MTLEQVLGIVRALMAAASGIAMAFGYLQSFDWVAITGAVVTVVTAVWSVLSKKQA